MLDGPGKKPSSILFACGMNAIRSPMAAALCQNLFPRRIYVNSAGVRSGDLDPFMVSVMDEVGLDLSKHRPHTFEDIEDSNFDLVITLAPEAHHMALELTRTQAMDVEYWPTPDPTLATGSRDQILRAYREVRDMLTMRIKKRLQWTPNASD
ncbi:MAG: low molecular weight phosphatase family protein [Stappiaceae bacterium]